MSSQSVIAMGRPHAQRLSCKATFSEEIAWIQYAYRSFLAVFRNDGKSDLALVDVEDRIAGCALSVDRFFLWKRHNLSALTDAGKELLRIGEGRKIVTFPKKETIYAQ